MRFTNQREKSQADTWQWKEGESDCVTDRRSPDPTFRRPSPVARIRSHHLNRYQPMLSTFSVSSPLLCLLPDVPCSTACTACHRVGNSRYGALHSVHAQTQASSRACRGSSLDPSTGAGRAPMTGVAAAQVPRRTNTAPHDPASSPLARMCASRAPPVAPHLLPQTHPHPAHRTHYRAQRYARMRPPPRRPHTAAGSESTCRRGTPAILQNKPTATAHIPCLSRRSSIAACSTCPSLPRLSSEHGH